MLVRTGTTTKLVFSVAAAIAQEFKKRVPTRKRSQLIEELLTEYFVSENKQQAWQAVIHLKGIYKKSQDPIKLSVTNWLHRDRRSH